MTTYLEHRSPTPFQAATPRAVLKSVPPTSWGWCVTLGPLVLTLLEAARAPTPLRLHVSAAAGLLAGALLLPIVPWLGRAIVFGGVAAASFLVLPVLGNSPGGALAWAVATVLSLWAAFSRRVANDPRGRTLPDALLSAIGAMSLGSGTASLAALLVEHPSRWAVIGAVAAFVLLAAAILTWAATAHDSAWFWRAFLALSVLAATVGALGARQTPLLALTAMLLPPTAAAFATGLARRWGDELSAPQANPVAAVVASFFLLCVAGGTLLALPFAARTALIAPIDGLFMSVSAVCVTGLAVVDPAASMSFAGQVVLAALIQLGGLGIMTLYAAIATLLGGRVSVQQEADIASASSTGAMSSFSAVLRQLMGVTFITEAIGATILSGLFWHGGLPWREAIWKGAFTAISGFCNAGFALDASNLVPFQTQPLVLHTVGLLIIIGGLSPAALFAIPHLRRGSHVIPIHARLVLVTTAALLLGSFALYSALEWDYSLGHLGFMDRLHNSWFQVVTPRTAGFNSIDLLAMQPATVTLMMLLMFVGGSPASTAGGIKTTTLAVLLLATVSAVRGRAETVVFDRKLSPSSVQRAMAVACLGLLAVLGLTLLLQLTQPLTAVEASFEAFSALGTVGLTLGATPKLDALGKILVMLGMFVGRVGPTTLFLLLVEQRPEVRVNCPEQGVIVG